MTASSMCVLLGTTLAAAVYGGVQWQSRSNVVTAGFWVDESVTFELPHLSRRGGPLSPEERARVVDVARREVAAAFDGLRVRVSNDRDALYRVRVLQILTWQRVAVSGRSNVFGPLGGSGAVSYETLASQAIARAPDGADRAAIVEGIGRGLGRAAVHEFAHQLLPKVPIHATTDEQSYEFWSSDRSAQYYGPMHWDVAREHLRRRFGEPTYPQSRSVPSRMSNEPTTGAR